jgi:hypothetical protein
MDPKLETLKIETTFQDMKRSAAISVGQSPLRTRKAAPLADGPWRPPPGTYGAYGAHNSPAIAAMRPAGIAGYLGQSSRKR